MQSEKKEGEGETSVVLEPEWYVAPVPPANATEKWLENVKLTWGEIIGPKFDDDMHPAAMQVRANLQVLEAYKEDLRSSNDEVRKWAEQERDEAVGELLPNMDEKTRGLILDYWIVRWERMQQSKRLRKNVPALVGVFNGAFVLVFLRLTIPRLLAFESMGDVGEFASSMGLPGKEELQGYLQYAEGIDTLTKFGIFTTIFTLEKVFLIGELIPVGIILPTISPVLFGSVATGVAVTATASTLASSVNFIIGREFLTKQVREFSIPGQGKLEEAGWFKAINRRFDSSLFPDSFPPEGFKAMLLLRLAPLLPIPVDAHWYVAGTTPVKFSEFFVAHFIGTFKVALLDAYLGSLLLQSIQDTEAVAQQTRTALVVETSILLIVSIVVTNIATSIFAQILTEEGVSVDDMSPMGALDAEGNAKATDAKAEAGRE